MNISYRNVNKDETYCCSKNDIKNFFPLDDEFRFYFYRPSRYRYHKTMQGIWLCHCSIHKNCYPDYEFLESYWNAPSINFFPFNKKLYPGNIKQKFLKEALPKIQEWCEIHYNFHPKATPGYQVLDISLNNNSLIYLEAFTRY